MLRAYQEDAIAKLRESYRTGHRAPCLVLPTGGGKTVIASAIVKGANARGTGVLFLAHRTELIDQTVRKLESAGIHDLRIIQASADLGSPTAPVTVASIPTLTRWKDRLPKAGLVLFDECHHGPSKTWGSLGDQYSTAQLLGLTATPERADGKAVGDMFDDLVIASSVKELTALGHLVPCVTWAPPAKLDTGELGLDPVAAYQRYGNDERAVVFCVSKQHAADVAEQFNAAGIVAAVVHGSLAKAERGGTLAAYERGEIRVLCNVHVLTEGWDQPLASVCILARRPGHDGTFLQMVGRVLRPAPGKKRAILLDLCGSVHQHGLPDDAREYSLTGRGIKKTDRLPLRQCPTCGAVFMTAVDCPMCGCELPSRPMQLPRSTGIGLAEVGAVAAPRRAVTIAIDSRYPGICRSCNGSIRVGDRIFWTKGEKPRHATCLSAAAQDAANRLLAEVG